MWIQDPIPLLGFGSHWKRAELNLSPGTSMHQEIEAKVRLTPERRQDLVARLAALADHHQVTGA